VVLPNWLKNSCADRRAHAEDAFLLEELPGQSQRYGFPLAASFIPSRWLKDGDSVQIGEEVLAVLHTPGHTPGHVAFFDFTANLALVGDVLFRGSIGRSDFRAAILTR